MNFCRGGQVSAATRHDKTGVKMKNVLVLHSRRSPTRAVYENVKATTCPSCQYHCPASRACTQRDRKRQTFESSEKVVFRPVPAAKGAEKRLFEPIFVVNESSARAQRTRAPRVLGKTLFPRGTPHEGLCPEAVPLLFFWRGGHNANSSFLCTVMTKQG